MPVLSCIYLFQHKDRRDVEGNPVCGSGEILTKGGNVAPGYYTMDDRITEVFTDDGWCHPGRIGQSVSDGSIRIVDRKKNLVKLKSGEYVALERMEMINGNSDFVDVVAGAEAFGVVLVPPEADTLGGKDGDRDGNKVGTVVGANDGGMVGDDTGNEDDGDGRGKNVDGNDELKPKDKEEEDDDVDGDEEAIDDDNDEEDDIRESLYSR